MPNCHDKNETISGKNSGDFQTASAPLPRALALALCCAFAAISCGAPARLMPTTGYELQLGRQHPLSGRVYAPAARDFRSPSQLTAALENARYLILGETHDNPDHHRLQAQLLAIFLAQHPAAQVGFEMLDETAGASIAR
jgi:uncharacterized iron-regulated protein